MDEDLFWESTAMNVYKLRYQKYIYEVYIDIEEEVHIINKNIDQGCEGEDIIDITDEMWNKLKNIIPCDNPIDESVKEEKNKSEEMLARSLLFGNCLV